MKSNILLQIACIISCAALFFLATYFGKSVEYLDVVFFVLGLCVGMALLAFDEKVLHKYYSEQGELERDKIEPQNNQVEKQKEVTPLVTRSLLFILLLFPLGLFLLTSTGSALGVGTFLGILLGLSLEIFALKNKHAEFKARFLYQLKRDITPEEQRVAVTFFIGATVLYAFFVIFLGR